MSGIRAVAGNAGAVTAAWKADSKANAGYTVIVRYKKAGEVAARANVAAGKAKATVKGLKAGKRLWVEVRPMYKSGGLIFPGAFNGAWAKRG